MTTRFPFLLIPLFALWVAGCAGATKATSSTPGQPATLSRQSGTDYARGLVALRNGDYGKAMEVFQAVARGPSYVRYTALARLRLADALFFQEQYDEAVEGYRGFIELNAADPNLHYAYFRMAESKVRSIAGDFLLMPPTDRRDPQRVWAALQLLDDFVARFPDSPHIDEALALRTKMAKTVASFEMEVARFYMTRKKPQGAINRIRRLMQSVPSVFRDEDTHLALAEALAAARDGQGLARACRTYDEVFPAGRHRAKVIRLCAGAPAVGAGAADAGMDSHGG
jgi:outer membrane protein assembly factor BamD